MSTTKRAGKVAIGMFLVLSIVVFGSILYVGFCCVNTEIVVLETAMEDVTDVERGEYLLARDSAESVRRGTIEYVPDWMPQEPIAKDSGREEPGYGIVAPPALEWIPQDPPSVRDAGRVEPGYGIATPPDLT